MSLRKTLYLCGLLALLGLAPALSACNTLSGAGEDVSAAGKAVTNSAEKTKESM